ncbi:MAG: ABC transporter permease, partial [Alphaproteobacteria bacterium]
MGAALPSMTPSGRGLRALAAVAVGLVILAPVLFGLWQTGRAAFGILPALGRESLSLDPWRALAALPGIATSLRLTLLTGVGATLGALALATGFCALATARPRRGFAQRLMAPFLAVPHAAMAVGLAFVLAPSGWIARLVAPLAGWDRPPALATVNDSWGIALMLGLMVKEVPFLVLVMLSALSQIPVGRHLAAARALGYARGVAWIKVILPQLWPMIRLPVLVVLSYGLSVVDMAIILGPSNPPTLAVALTRWFADPDPAMILPASAGAL